MLPKTADNQTEDIITAKERKSTLRKILCKFFRRPTAGGCY